MTIEAACGRCVSCPPRHHMPWRFGPRRSSPVSNLAARCSRRRAPTALNENNEGMSILHGPASPVPGSPWRRGTSSPIPPAAESSSVWPLGLQPRTGAATFDDAYERLMEIDALGFDALLAEHRKAWAHRWTDASVVIEGDPDSEIGNAFRHVSSPCLC